MECQALISEKGGNGSAMIKENIKEVCEVFTVVDCNMYLKAGWGLLAVVPGGSPHRELNLGNNGVVYVMSRTVK